MIPDVAERTRSRRLGALFVLVVGIALAFNVLGPSLPREQPFAFRLPEPPPEYRLVSLAAQLTPSGEREPITGISVTLGSPRPREVRQRLRAPNGDYIVSVQLTWEHSFNDGDPNTNSLTGPSPPVKTETSCAHRVSLKGHETLVVLDSKGL